MKQIVITLLLALFCSMTFAQSFEGKVVYKNTYKSKSPKLSDSQMTTMFGSVQNYYVKGGNYKSIMNGQLVQWQLYIAADNKIYNKMSNSPKVIPFDAGLNDDEVISAKVEKGAIEILGYECDKLTLRCKSGTQTYFFAPKLKIDKTLYKKHMFGNYYAYLSLANAIPLKITIDAPTFHLEGIAIEVKPGKLNDNVFELEQ